MNTFSPIKNLTQFWIDKGTGMCGEGEILTDRGFRGRSFLRKLKKTRAVIIYIGDVGIRICDEAYCRASSCIFPSHCEREAILIRHAIYNGVVEGDDNNSLINQ